MTQIPEIKVDSTRKIFDDGNHNAFTDMCRFDGNIYLAFRSCPDGHQMFPSSRIIVMSSRDGAEWKQVFSFGVPLRDVRDPHFLVFRDKLFVYTATWLCNPATPGVFSANDQLGYTACTIDGRVWDAPRSLEGTYGHYIWRAAAHGGKAYLCGRRVRDFTPTDGEEAKKKVMESALLESEDGFVWKWCGLFQKEQGNETAFIFEDSNSILAVARSSGENAMLCRSKFPFQEWTRTPLNHNVGGPLLVKWGDHYLVGGRKIPFGDNPKTVLSWLVGNRLEDIVELPSGGDTSYPGFVAISDKKGLLSYYSSHEGSNSKLAPCSIYLAELSLNPGTNK